MDVSHIETIFAYYIDPLPFIHFLPTKMKHISFVTTLLLSVFVSITAYAGSYTEKQKVIDAMYRELSQARTATDSLLPMSNIYDLMPRTLQRDTLMWRILSVARRAKNTQAEANMIRHLANNYIRNDSILSVLRNLADSLPGGPERDETITFVRIMQKTNSLRFNNDTLPSETFNKLLHQDIYYETEGNDNIYNHIVRLYSICLYIGNKSQGQLLEEYIDKLDKLIEQLPPNAYSLRNTFYVMQAYNYAECSLPEKSIEADKKLLKLITSLQENYAKEGRKFRNYDDILYVIYTRMLSNHAALDSAQIELYYDKAIECTGLRPSAAFTNKTTPLPQIYYSLAHHRYKEAIPLIKKALKSKLLSNGRRRLLLRDLITCADSINDKSTLNQAMRDYTALLEERLHEQKKEKLEENAILSQASNIRMEFDRLKIEKSKTEATALRNILIVSATALLILLILVFILARLNSRTKALTLKLKDANKKLTEERAQLMQSRDELAQARDTAMKANNFKSDFIKNMSHEITVPLKVINEYSRLITDFAENEEDKKYLNSFVRMVELNSELLSAIINDVLHLTEIDHSTISIKRQHISLATLCQAAVNGMSHRTNKGVEMTFDKDISPDTTLYTDPQRLQQILNNLLINAAKFTDSGSIHLAYTVDKEAGKVIISVTDTGTGIPAKEKDRIFERFVKLDSEKQGAGLGLPISRLLARLLNGDVSLDTTWKHKGTRMLITLPIR